MRNDITIDFLAIIDEGPTEDTEVNMTMCVAMDSPAWGSRRHVAVYFDKVRAELVGRNCPHESHSAVYYFLHELFKLN